jgi:hypothetical protein
MTPRQFVKEKKRRREEEEERNCALAEKWHVPLFSNGGRLKSALSQMVDWRLDAKDVPFFIRLFENPSSPLCEFGIMPGCVNLFAHDCIHILLGRGILPKDEAFVIGFTMGSTKRMNWFREKVFLFIARWLYPEGYKFHNEERQIFNLGLIAGKKCDTDLTKVNFEKMGSWKMSAIRTRLGVDTKFIKICYLLEKKAYPNSKESQRLL